MPDEPVDDRYHPPKPPPCPAVSPQGLVCHLLTGHPDPHEGPDPQGRPDHLVRFYAEPPTIQEEP